MLKINIHEAKTHLSRYARRVKAGEHFLICDRNIPFAELRPLKPVDGLRSERPLGMDAGKAHLSDDWDSPETNREIAQLFSIE
jgi:antitoxin (DNA-binding transcriptional repressor) of toxin-antitoxin stability system